MVQVAAEYALLISSRCRLYNAGSAASAAVVMTVSECTDAAATVCCRVQFCTSGYSSGVDGEVPPHIIGDHVYCMLAMDVLVKVRSTHTP